MNTIKRVLKFLLGMALAILAIEYGLRAVKTKWRDGRVYLKTPSIDSRLHPKYGWISPPNFSFSKSDDCFGTGIVSYNDLGFRAPPSPKAVTADAVICIIGDSTMHGYQIPDGNHLPHLLSVELKRRGLDAYVLPLAVGGYGSVQQLLLFEDYCSRLRPDLLIWAWAHNDPTNNSFLADRFGGPNNARPRPYLERGEIVVRRAYPLHIHDTLDQWMILRLINGITLRAQQVPEGQYETYREEGWRVANEIAMRLAAQMPATKIALVPAAENAEIHAGAANRARNMFLEHGFLVAVYELSDEHTCAPRDPHSNPRGHRLILDVLLPHVLRALEKGKPIQP